ncbi:hypothetical protein DFH27DRAFT_567625 [Peziza echinospora]|nr:hypothetical protein DFH27DRAFT_567625 [Peziza echinospora]
MAGHIFCGRKALECTIHVHLLAFCIETVYFNFFILFFWRGKGKVGWPGNDFWFFFFFFLFFPTFSNVLDSHS